MGVEEKICHFYYDVVNQLQKDFKLGSLFLEQASTSMIFGREFGDSSLSSKEAYEMIFLSHLSYSKVDNYNRYGIEKLLLAKKISMIGRLAYELEKEDDLSITLSLLGLKNKDYIETYKAFSELKNIIRTGWISRKVEESYRENDSIHSMQMFALAYAYFNLDKSISLDQKKVYEMILIHEIGEIIAGDIREGDKRHKTKYEIEKKAVEQTFSYIKTGDYFISLWEEFENKETEEAFFTYQLDKIDPILKAIFLDLELNRKDLFSDFLSYEKERGTFERGKVKKLFQYIEKKGYQKESREVRYENN